MRALVVGSSRSGGGVAAARVCLHVVGGDARAPVPQKSIIRLFRPLLSAPLPSAQPTMKPIVTTAGKLAQLR